MTESYPTHSVCTGIFQLNPGTLIAPFFLFPTFPKDNLWGYLARFLRPSCHPTNSVTETTTNCNQGNYQLASFQLTPEGRDVALYSASSHKPLLLCKSNAVAINLHLTIVTCTVYDTPVNMLYAYNSKNTARQLMCIYYEMYSCRNVSNDIFGICCSLFAVLLVTAYDFLGLTKNAGISFTLCGSMSFRSVLQLHLC